MPCWTPQVAIRARQEKSSLSRMCCTWVAAVCSLMHSEASACVAIGRTEPTPRHHPRETAKRRKDPLAATPKHLLLTCNGTPSAQP